MCVHLCVRSWAAVLHLRMFYSIVNGFCLYNFIRILSSFLTNILVLGWNWQTINQRSPTHKERIELIELTENSNNVLKYIKYLCNILFHG